MNLKQEMRFQPDNTTTSLLRLAGNIWHSSHYDLQFSAYYQFYGQKIIW